MKKSQKKFIESAYKDSEVCQGYKDKIKEHFPKIIKKLEKQRLPIAGEWVEIKDLSEGCLDCPTGFYHVLMESVKGSSGLMPSNKGFNVLVESEVWRVNGKYKILSREEILKYKINEIQEISYTLPNISIDVEMNYKSPGCSSTHYCDSIECR